MYENIDNYARVPANWRRGRQCMSQSVKGICEYRACGYDRYRVV